MPPTLAPLAAAALAAFLGTAVEAVEALTVVLAIGLVRGWRGALAGALAGVILLAALVLVLGPALAAIPLRLVQLVVGLALLWFGLRWLKKAVLRAAGRMPLHDEAASFAQETTRLRRLEPGRSGLDGVAVAGAVKIVLLEGIEVVFIVIATGAGGPDLLAAATAGAVAALLLVIALGIAIHRPIARLPANGVKLVVGVLLTGFGGFWLGEGLGIPWPGGDLALPGFILVAGLATRWAIGWVRAGKWSR